MSEPRWIRVWSFSARESFVDSTTGLKPYAESEKIDDATSESFMFGHDLTFSSRCMSTVGSIAVTASSDAPGSLANTVSTSITKASSRGIAAPVPTVTETRSLARRVNSSSSRSVHPPPSSRTATPSFSRSMSAIEAWSSTSIWRTAPSTAAGAARSPMVSV